MQWPSDEKMRMHIGVSAQRPLHKIPKRTAFHDELGRTDRETGAVPFPQTTVVVMVVRRGPQRLEHGVPIRRRSVDDFKGRSFGCAAESQVSQAQGTRTIRGTIGPPSTRVFTEIDHHVLGRFEVLHAPADLVAKGLSVGREALRVAGVGLCDEPRETVERMAMVTARDGNLFKPALDARGVELATTRDFLDQTAPFMVGPRERGRLKKLARGGE